MLGYSFGGLVTLEIALLLEEEGFEGMIYLVDSSPKFMRLLQEFNFGNLDNIDIKLLCSILRLLAPQHASTEFVDKVR